MHVYMMYIYKHKCTQSIHTQAYTLSLMHLCTHAHPHLLMYSFTGRFSPSLSLSPPLFLSLSSTTFQPYFIIFFYFPTHLLHKAEVKFDNDKALQMPFWFKVLLSPNCPHSFRVCGDCFTLYVGQVLKNAVCPMI